MAGGQFGDTTYTKVFVGGLAWETKKETMRQYFEQFGEILEAVIITDKNTGRSKGYGFVTFRDPDSAMRACLDPTPVIDGRRANCNIASLGAHRSRSAGVAGKFRMVSTYPATGIHGPYMPYGGTTFSAAAATACPPAYYPPYQTFGYSPYAITAAATGTAETANAYSFHPNFLGQYMGMGSSSSSNNQQLYNPSPPPPTAAAPAPFYQYYQVPQPLPSSQNFSLNYTPFFQYPAVAAPTPPAPSAPTMSSLQQPQQQYAAMMSITSGMTMAAVQHVPHQATVYQLPAPASQNGAAAAAAVSASASAPPAPAESIHDLNPAV